MAPNYLFARGAKLFVCPGCQIINLCRAPAYLGPSLLLCVQSLVNFTNNLNNNGKPLHPVGT
jgi:hypothetical protein